MNEGLFRLVQAVLDKQGPLDAESLRFLKKRFKAQCVLTEFLCRSSRSPMSLSTVLSK